MANGRVLVATLKGKLGLHRVDGRPSPVPWASGIKAVIDDGVVVFETGQGTQSTPHPVTAGRAVLLGGIPTSCHEVIHGPGTAPLVRLGPDLEAVSEAMIRVFHQISLYAPATEPALLLGESGTGKDLVASVLHHLGPGNRDPLFALNMAAIPAELAEAELFGWVRGAFTGAVDSRPGAMEAAGNGTLFLDEIGDTSPAVQAKLLRAVESGTIVRVGSRKPVGIRARIVAATNRDLSRAMAEEGFRRDLLERLACLVLRIPPMRERKEDIPVIAHRFCRSIPGNPGITARGRFRLLEHDWPGNARELRNVIQRASLLTLNGPLTEAAIRESLAATPWAAVRRKDGGRAISIPARITRRQQINLSGLPRSTFYYRLKKGRIAIA